MNFEDSIVHKSNKAGLKILATQFFSQTEKLEKAISLQKSTVSSDYTQGAKAFCLQVLDKGLRAAASDNPNGAASLAGKIAAGCGAVGAFFLAGEMIDAAGSLKGDMQVFKYGLEIGAMNAAVAVASAFAQSELTVEARNTKVDIGMQEKALPHLERTLNEVKTLVENHTVDGGALEHGVVDTESMMTSLFKDKDLLSDLDVSMRIADKVIAQSEEAPSNKLKQRLVSSI